MSHVSVMDMEVNDLESLEKACNENPDLEFVRNQRTHKWFGQWMDDYDDADAAYRKFDPKTFGTCEHAIRVKGDGTAYEVGVRAHPTKKGAYSLLWDFYGDHGRRLKKAIGPDGKKLL
ncbi:hypothetical protein LCGC14_2528170, partial [marine sediment metagenome]